MNKPLLLSVAAAAILGTNLQAESMYDRIQSMELHMKQMEKELSALKSTKPTTQLTKAVAEEEEDDEAEDDDENETTKVSDKTQKATKSSLVDEEEDDEDDEPEKIDVEEEIADIKENLTELNKATNGSHLKFGVDYRFALDNMQYTMADGSKMGNDAFMTNRLWINMDWKATNHLSFSGQLAYNKAFEYRSGVDSDPANHFDTFDWITNENAYDDVVRVRSAYFLYKNDTFLSASIPWTFSIGRRPSTNGHLINLRDDDGAASPMGHTINVEFDGLSSKFGLEDLTGVNGMYVKLCAGRGMTNAAPKLTAAPYSHTDSNPDIDLAGLIFVPWNNGHYGIATQYYYANNLIDAHMPTSPTDAKEFDTVGGLHSFTANLTVNGIGNEWSDYLDDTTLFVSGAVSVTDPKSDQGMLGSKVGESVTGYSAWIGLQMPSFMSEDGRWGLEYNKGSKYWRSITYAEDTNIGSKIATRGDAYEAYFTEPLIDDILSLQIRYTYIDYKYAGSNGFFGNTTGDSTLVSRTDGMMVPSSSGMINRGSATLDTAQDIRFYLRYRY